MPYTLEVCVDSTASALAAMQGGAHRLELCADLVIGGTTPSLALLQQVKAETGLPVRALLRPRFGDFCYDRWELAQMAQSAARLVEAGADGIVTGVLTPEGGLDVEALQPIYAAARAFHLSGKRVLDSRMTFRREGVPMGLPGFSEFALWQTDAGVIRRARSALDSL